MEKNFIYHEDLNHRNILLSLETNNIEIIDFDGCGYLNKEGDLSPISSDIEFISQVKNSKTTIYKRINNKKNEFILFNLCADNIFLPFQSNLDLFELLFMREIEKQFDNEEKLNIFLDEYIIEKSKYIKKRYNFYTKKLLLNKNKTINIDNFKYALKIDNAIAYALKQKNEDIYEIEKLKLKLKYNLYRYHFYKKSDKEKYKKICNNLFNELEKKLSKVNTKNKKINLYLYSQRKWIEKWGNIERLKI